MTVIRMEALEGKIEIKTKFIELRAKGLSLRKIASQLNVSVTTLTTWSKELEAEIGQRKALELEALQEQYYLLKEGRIKLLGEQVKAIQEELETRSLAEVSTDKLLELYLRYFDQLKAEFVEPHYQNESGTKLDSEGIEVELASLLRRYRSGNADQQQVTREAALLLALLKAHDQASLQKKLAQLAAVLESRS